MDPWLTYPKWSAAALASEIGPMLEKLRIDRSSFCEWLSVHAETFLLQQQAATEFSSRQEIHALLDQMAADFRSVHDRLKPGGLPPNPSYRFVRLAHADGEDKFRLAEEMRSGLAKFLSWIDRASEQLDHEPARALGRNSNRARDSLVLRIFCKLREDSPGLSDATIRDAIEEIFRGRQIVLPVDLARLIRQQQERAKF